MCQNIVKTVLVGHRRPTELPFRASASVPDPSLQPLHHFLTARQKLYEALAFALERLLDSAAASNVHVVMLYGHARGFAEQILNPEGQSVTTAEGGIPQFTFADLGMPAYAPADQGGIYHFGLLRIGDDGDLQYSVEPALASITVKGPKDRSPRATTSP